MGLDIAAATEALAAASPHAAAIEFRGRVLTRAALADRTRRLAAVLAGAGLGDHPERVREPGWESPHDHVALYLHNGPEYLEGMLGAWKARCSAFNVNYRYVADELRYLLDDADTAAIVVHDRFVDTLESVLDDLQRPPALILQVRDGTERRMLPGASDYEDALAAASPHLSAELVGSWSGDDLYLCYTGGTTGMPKGTMWRQGDFCVAALGFHRRDGSRYESVDDVVADARPTLRSLPSAPFMHGAAHWNALATLLRGGCVVIGGVVDRFDPSDVLDTVERCAATALLVVGDPMARPLIDVLRSERDEGRGRDLSSLRHVLSGGAVLSEESRSAMFELLGPVTIIDVLGSTEGGRQAVAKIDGGDSGTELGRGVGSEAGTFRPESSAVVLNDRLDGLLSPGSSEIGWLARRGPMPLGYLGDSAKTEHTFPSIDGVRYSVPGDRARLDPEGRIELLGRDSVCINTGGEKVFAEEVETALKTHPAVRDAVVCGRPSPRWGQEVVGIVELRDGSDPADEELRDAAGQHLARYKLPRAIVRVDRIERSPSGKADYRWASAVAFAAGAAPKR